MDQTTDTADLLETEKYLLNTVKEDSESDSDIEEEVAQDALLGGIRSTLSTITRTTREALSTCKNKPELDDAVSKIEDSTLRLLKLEKSFLKTATIVSEVIDDLVSDFEDDEEAGVNVGLDTGTSPTKGSGDASISNGPSEPYVFQLSRKNLASVATFKDKLSKV
ncbi:unnamed protein product [Orchesella dallaii]|uniref:Biogenesis of lysosome-related organelles complex 1 subunit 3 n=1 Tax=Orchesella dallaii TaxID=48710 RepID=A0ABP1QNA7_9HEXA